MPKTHRWLTWTAAAMAGGLWVACGQGIYTYNRFPDSGADDASNSATDQESRPTPDSRPSDGRGDPADGQVLDGLARDALTDLSVPPDTGNPSTAATVDWQGGEVVAGDGRLVVPKNVLANSGQITLTQLSSDGTLPGYSGAVGPVFSISKSAVFQQPARFELKLPPDPGIPVSQLALAYIDPKARIWIGMESTYDSTADIISVDVSDFSSPWTIGPVLGCNSLSECDSATAWCQGGVCQCQGGVCQ